MKIFICFLNAIAGGMLGSFVNSEYEEWKIYVGLIACVLLMQNLVLMAYWNLITEMYFGKKS